MSSFESYIFDFFLSYSSEPLLVYSIIFLLMTAGSFGLPISEEVVIVSAALLAYIGGQHEFHPVVLSTPYPETVTISGVAVVCFLSIFMSDILVYSLGRFFGQSIINSKVFHNVVSRKNMEKIAKVVLKYRFFYPAIFRFMPGLRFPGHFSSGVFRIPFWQFAAVVGIAALLTVPTQVFLVGYFGESIIPYLKEFVLIILTITFLFVCVFIYKFIRGLTKKELIKKEDTNDKKIQ